MVFASPRTSRPCPLTISWEKLPDDFQLPNDPVDKVNQSALAAALTESLYQAGLVAETAFTMTNYGICATINRQIVVKAPDWAYVVNITVPRSDIERSYTPNLQGPVPSIVKGIGKIEPDTGCAGGTPREIFSCGALNGCSRKSNALNRKPNAPNVYGHNSAPQALSQKIDGSPDPFRDSPAAYHPGRELAVRV